MAEKLTKILANLITYSTRDGLPKACPLKNGLIIMAHVQPTKFTLNISRANVEPSFVEWRTVAASLPETHKPVTPVIPAMYQDGPRIILSASWQLPERLL